MVKYADHIERIANTKALGLLKRPGVNLVVAGSKHSGGVDTGKRCLSIGVTRKLPMSELTPGELLPRSVGGIATDVFEVPPIRAHSATAKHRPVQGGISGYIGKPGFVATFGGVVMDTRRNRLVGLVNNHCAGLLYDPAHEAPSSGNLFTTGLDYFQPALADGGQNPDDKLGTVVRAVPIKFGPEAPANFVDAAIVSLDGLNVAGSAIRDIHTGPYPFGTGSVGMTVRKSGRVTGVTIASITSMAAAVSVNFGGVSAVFANQILITGEGFTTGGDSGSFITANIGGTICTIGLHFAGSGSVSVSNRIDDVAFFLGISAWDGSVIVPRNVSDEIHISGIAYTWSGNTTSAITHEVDE